MRSCVLSVCFLALCITAKPLEEKAKALKTNIEQVQPAAEFPERVSLVDGERTVRDEIATVVGGSVENLIPFGAVDEKSESVKKETPEVQLTEQSPLADWLGLVFNEALDKTEEVLPTSTSVSEKVTKLAWLRMALNHEDHLRHGLPTISEPSTTTAVPVVSKDAEKLHWPIARELAAHLLGRTMIDVMDKENPQAFEKSKFRWSKLLAEPIENTAQYVPSDNTVQWSSAEMGEMNGPPAQMIEMPSNIPKNKYQWFDDEQL